MLLSPAPPSAQLAALPSDLTPAASRLRGYLSLDTRNPPGREQSGALYLAQILADAGVEHRLLVTPSGRTSLWARLRARAGIDSEALVLLHHIDVVAPGSGWNRAPFGGVLEEKVLWGRGAVDAKSLGIVHLEAILTLAAADEPRTRDLIFLATADEEQGGREGVEYLLDEHPDLFTGAAGVLNEGGSNRQINGRLLWFGIEVAQKRPLWLRLRTRGRAGHAAGYSPHSAVHRLTRGLARLVDLPATWRVTPPVENYLAAMAPLQNERWRRLFTDIRSVIRPEGPAVGLLPGMESMFLDTIQVTRLEGSEQINSIAREAIAEVDIRLLPDTDDERFLGLIRETLGGDIEVEVLASAPPSAPSPVDHPVYRLLENALQSEAPVVPHFSPGFTDSRFFRQRGIPAYGFSPFALEPQELAGIHDRDEKISLASFAAGRRRMIDLARTWTQWR